MKFLRIQDHANHLCTIAALCILKPSRKHSHSSAPYSIKDLTTAMSHIDEHLHEERLTQMEIKITYAEDLLETLNTLVARQQEQIAFLQREIAQLHRQREVNSPTHALRSLRDELPPHY
jgi:SlyX protein